MQSFGPLALGSYSANALWKDIRRSFDRLQGIRLGKMIFKEYEDRPSGLILPNNKVLKKYNGVRARRVLWKIARGLFFDVHGKYLPNKQPRRIDLVSVGEKPNSEFAYVADAKSCGRYPGIFDFKHKEYDDECIHIWAYLLWDKIISIVYFHSPECICESCESESPQ